MICSLGRAKMARLLASGIFSHTIADDFGRQKSAAEYICRELRQADEANLLDEEDMHVFGSKPMTDPLQLVCCNACKKPIKDSQFAAHAELCRSLKLTEQNMLELDGSMPNRKPPRKEKKKLSTSCANQAAMVGERRRSESMETIDTAALQSYLNSQNRVTSFPKGAKGCSSCVAAASMMDGTGINPGNRDHPASVMHPPTKRHKLIASAHPSLPESPGTESGATKTKSFTDGTTSRHLLEINVPEHEIPNPKNLGRVREQHFTKQDFPVPLATKIYCSQRNNHLRTALGHLYFQNSRKELCSDVAIPKTSNGGMVEFQVSCEIHPSFEQVDSLLNKESHLASLCPAPNSGHILTKSSEICLQKSGGLLVDNFSRSAATHVGLTGGKFLPESYSFAGSTGNPLGTIQQSKGSVSVT